MLVKDLRAGDMLFVMPNGWIGDMIDYASGPGNDPCHIAQVVVDLWQTLWVYEMTSPMARRTTLPQWMAENNSTGLVHVGALAQPLTLQQSDRLRDYWNGKLAHWWTRTYDYLQLPVLWVWLRVRRLRSLFGGKPLDIEPIKGNGVCSQVVKEAMEFALDSQLPHWMQSPADLSRWDGLRPCEPVES